MGGFESVLAGSVINSVFDAKAARQQNKALAQRQALEQRQLALSRNVETKNRREKLRTDQASQRARFGALGISSAGGSSGAVLRGLSTDAARDVSELNQAFDLRSLGAAQDFAARRRQNLLDLRRKQFNTLKGIASRFPR